MTWRTPVILATAVITVVGLNWVRNTQYKPEVLAENIEIAPTLIPSPTTEPTDTPKPTQIPTPTKKPTPTPKPQPNFSPEQIYNFTNQYGGRYGVDPNVIRHIAICESAFKPEARNWIYAGLFQFDVQTWQTYRRKMGESADPDLRYNAEEAVKTAAYVLSLGQQQIWPNCHPN